MGTNPRSEREARRELLREALERLAAGRDDPERAADEALRAIDAYVDHHRVELGEPEPREPPVMARGPRDDVREIRWATWAVLGGAVVVSIIVAGLVGSGGWPTALAVLAVWVGAVLLLSQT